MQKHVLNRKWSREIDRRAVTDYAMSSLTLMENAGRGVCDLLCKLGDCELVVIVCGKGNNGGDGFVVARHLDLRGVPTRTLLLAQPEQLSGDAAANYAILARSGVHLQVIQQPVDTNQLNELLTGASCIVDALLGTGFSGPMREPIASIIHAMNEHPAPKVAIDIPSGLDCDTGKAAEPTVRAQHTCTFVSLKPGLLATGATAFTGKLHVADIGAPRKLVEEVFAAATEERSISERRAER